MSTFCTVVDPESVGQYTGLKNLYENDIIEILQDNNSDHGFGLPRGNKCIIVWDDMNCSFCISSLEAYQYNQENKGHSSMDQDYYGLVSENLEIPIICYSKVIGNTIDNKDLLK